ncbi:MAG: hypothetical protein EOO03_13735, partial [Chitinophagaceae bacterium]
MKFSTNNIPPFFTSPVKAIYCLLLAVIIPGLVGHANELAHRLQTMSAAQVPVREILTYTKSNRPLEIIYFPGTTDKNVLIVGGMHGSELSSIELAHTIVAMLQKGERPTYNTWIIPSLFPDNAARAAAAPSLIGGLENLGRYSGQHSIDPNRQMPMPGVSYTPHNPVDSRGRLIEIENQWLLDIIQHLQPERIAALHAIRNVAHAGVFADPRTDCAGIAKGFSADSVLHCKWPALFS